MIFSKKLLKHKSIKHSFLNRSGGVSIGIYKGMNCGKGSLDQKKNVKKNLITACKKISSSYIKLVLLNQTHSNKYHFINNYNLKKNYKGDALITKKKKLILGILTADCAPIFIYDKELKLISAIHAGWKGAYKGIVKRVVKFFVKKGSKLENLIAAIGPCISQKNYEVGNDFKKKFLKQTNKNRIFFERKKNKTYFSLNKYIYFQLKQLGIKKIDIIDKDTYNPRNQFFSARRSKFNGENDYGRNISLIMIK